MADEHVRARLARGPIEPADFRAALLAVAPLDRDGWLDRVLGIDEIPADGPALPAGGVPYLPCPVDTLLRALELADVRATDVFVDLGSGLGRAVRFAHLMTGAAAIGIEIQPALARASRESARGLPRVAIVEGDAASLTGSLTTGNVFFLYCPFSGERLQRVLRDLEAIARTRSIRVCCVDLPLPPCSWLEAVPPAFGDLVVYRSVS